ncbi:MAG TPA: twin-arginine translocase TatA/TatE family subunit [Oculatellaceae cyanobacterium]
MLGSPVDLALVFGIALVVFGPKKLPELGKSVGLGIANFKSALNQDLTESTTKTVTPQPQDASAIDAPSIVHSQIDHNGDSSAKQREASAA